MTNGGGAVLAEIVENPLPNDRIRCALHRHPLYDAQAAAVSSISWLAAS
jgi:nitrate/nitrite transport system ATP-binding protein